jgi:hypothetical protein
METGRMAPWLLEKLTHPVLQYTLQGNRNKTSRRGSAGLCSAKFRCNSVAVRITQEQSCRDSGLAAWLASSIEAAPGAPYAPPTHPSLAPGGALAVVPLCLGSRWVWAAAVLTQPVPAEVCQTIR